MQWLECRGRGRHITEVTDEDVDIEEARKLRGHHVIKKPVVDEDAEIDVAWATLE